MYVWHVCNKLQKCPLANKWCLRVIALHSRTWVPEGPRLFLHTGAVQELWNEQRNWKILKILDAPSDLHGQGRISMETRGATLRSDWLGKDQRLPTARDQLPKQVHLPLTLHCKCSQTKRTHIASSKPQPGVRKAIAHCAPTPFHEHATSDLQEYQKLSLSQSSGQKGKPEPSEGQNCHGRRTIPLAQASNRLVTREGHCKWMEKPGAQPPANSGSPHRSSEKTHRPAARQWAPCLNLYQPKGTVFYFFRVTSRSIKTRAFFTRQAKLAQRKSRHLGASFNRGPDQHLRGNAIASTLGIPEDQPPAFSTNRR